MFLIGCCVRIPMQPMPIPHSGDNVFCAFTSIGNVSWFLLLQGEVKGYMALQMRLILTESYENSMYNGPFLYSKHKTSAICLPMCRRLFSKLTVHWNLCMTVLLLGVLPFLVAFDGHCLTKVQEWSCCKRCSNISTDWQGRCLGC